MITFPPSVFPENSWLDVSGRFTAKRAGLPGPGCCQVAPAAWVRIPAAFPEEGAFREPPAGRAASLWTSLAKVSLPCPGHRTRPRPLGWPTLPTQKAPAPPRAAGGARDRRALTRPAWRPATSPRPAAARAPGQAISGRCQAGRPHTHPASC